MQKEIWKDVVEYEGLYQVSSLGSVKRLKGYSRLSEKILKPFLTRYGYYQYKLYKFGKGSSKEVHRLIAAAFLKHKPDGHNIVIDHIDNNQLNNKLSNIQLITQRENCIKDKNHNTIGAYRNKNGWYSQIYLNGKKKHLGTFKSKEEANNTYKNELIKIENYEFRTKR